MSLLSTATFASPKTKSLRATIPEGIVAYLDLKAGDKLEWRMEIEDGKKVVKLRKEKRSE
ncbi:MAG: AbrB family transcriptional regulator [Nitrososphaeria archaeon]|jgi:bifunctional DNA-binding transcriptional regulator/antitoxin component of YhaV-PrlF toxin-antitoxin module